MFADGAEMSLFAHRSYKPDEQLDPIDREIIKRGLARLKLQDDGSFLLVDNADAASGTLVVQVARQRIAREFENAARAEAEAKERAAKGGDRAETTAKAVLWSECLHHRYKVRYGKKPKWKDTDEKAAKKYGRSVNAVRNCRQEKQREKRLE